MKRIITLILAAAVMLSVLCGCSAGTADNKAKITITLSVDCKTAVDAGCASALAVTSDGVLYPEQTVSLPEGSTAFDALKATGLVLGCTRSPMGEYVYSVQSVREGDGGGQSGWMYFLNDQFVAVSCDKCVLHDGDLLRWQYSCDGGSDLGHGLK